MELPAWEQSKENILPLRKGRKIESLQQQTDSQPAKQKEVYEMIIDTYEGEDPLEPWCSYIEWTEQSFPKGGKESNVSGLLQRCAARFRDDQRYYNDPRFVSIFLSLADLATEPLEIYQYMSSLNIGNEVAEFYICWAMELEWLGKFKNAEVVYQHGLRKNAEPREELIQKHKQFSARIVRLSVDKTQNTEAPITEEHRAILGPLKPSGRRHHVGTNRIGSAKLGSGPGAEIVQSASASESNRLPRHPQITVFVDENVAASRATPVQTTNVRSALPNTLDSKKENERKPSKWVDAVIPVKPLATTSAVKFSVHVDENISQPETCPLQKSIEATQALSAKKVKPTDILKAIRAGGDKKVEEFSKKFKCCITKLYTKQGEMQFEELRAARWRQNRSENKAEDSEIPGRPLSVECESGVTSVPELDHESSLLKIKENLVEAIKSFSMQIANGKVKNENFEIAKVLDPVNHQQPRISGSYSVECLINDVLQLSLAIKKIGNERLIPEAAERVGNERLQPEAAERACNERLMPEAAERVIQKGESKPCILQGGQQQKQQQLSSSERSSLPNSRSSSTSKPSLQTSILTISGDTTKMIRGLWDDPAFVPLDEAQKRSENAICTDDGNAETPLYSTNKSKMAFTVFQDSSSCGSGLTRSANQPLIVPHVTEQLNPLPPSAKTKLAFTVFQDSSTCSSNLPRSTDLPVVVPLTSGCPDGENLDHENLQNIPPKDYKENVTKRTLVGILQPSTDIEYCPLNDLKMEDEDNLDGICPMSNDLHQTDFTILCPTTTGFFKNLKCASTPAKGFSVGDERWKEPEHENKPHKDDWVNPNLVLLQERSSNNFMSKDHVFTSKCSKPSVYGIPTKLGNLSAISETSREYRSSSSSGTVSSAASHWKSQLSAVSRNRTHEDVSDLLSKTDKSKFASDQPIDHQDNNLLEKYNPFDDKTVDALLDNLNCQLSSRLGYIQLQGSLPQIKYNGNVCLGDADMYYIMGNCVEGGYAKVFKAMDLSKMDEACCNLTADIALKVQQPPCRLEFYISKELISRIKKLKFKCSALPSIMDITKMYVFSDASVQVTKCYPYGTLLDIVNLYTSRGSTMPECLALYFTIEILHIMEQIHACHIIHADVKPDNFLLMEIPKLHTNIYGGKDNTTKSLKLIDYGLSIDMELFPVGTTFTARVKTDQFQCHEMLENKPWTYQTDYYGVAANAFVMLYGDYMNTTKVGDTWKLKSAIKRYWSENWKQFFHQLLNIPSCDHQPDVRAIRENLEIAFNEKRVQKEFPEKVRQLQTMLTCKRV